VTSSPPHLTDLSHDSLIQTIRTGGKDAKEQIIATIQHLADGQPPIKRIVIANEANTLDREIVVLIPDTNLQTFIDLVQQELGKNIVSLSFEGIPLQEKHLRILQDRDILIARFG